MLLHDDAVHLQSRKQLTGEAVQSGLLVVMALPVVLLQKPGNRFQPSSTGLSHDIVVIVLTYVDCLREENVAKLSQ